MRIEPQPQSQTTATGAESGTLLVSFELSQGRWLLTVRQPDSAKLSRFAVEACDTQTVLALLRKRREQAERHTGQAVKLASIYEAGRDGFWLHRWLEAPAVESHVVDPASILGPQRRRKAKTDRIDGVKLLRRLAARRSGGVLAGGAAEHGAGGSPAPLA